MQVLATKDAPVPMDPPIGTVSLTLTAKEHAVLCGLLHYDKSMKQRAFGDGNKKASNRDAAKYEAAQTIIDGLRDGLRALATDPYQKQ